MALTALSDGVLLPIKMQDLGIAGNQLCAIVGIPSSRLSLCVNGIRDLDHPDARSLHETLDKLNRLQQAVPFPLHFKDAARWRSILKWMDDEDIQVDDIAEAMNRLFKRDQS